MCMRVSQIFCYILSISINGCIYNIFKNYLNLTKMFSLLLVVQETGITDNRPQEP